MVVDGVEEKDAFFRDGLGDGIMRFLCFSGFRVPDCLRVGFLGLLVTV